MLPLREAHSYLYRQGRLSEARPAISAGQHGKYIKRLDSMTVACMASAHPRNNRNSLVNARSAALRQPERSAMKVRSILALAVAFAAALLPTAASASSGWQITSTPSNPYGTQTGAYASLASVSCISSSACTAVGSAAPASSNTAHGGGGPAYTLAEHWNGTSWKIQATPTPSDTQAGEPLLQSVKCVSSSFCMAVGSYNTSTSYNESIFAERWNGASWKILHITQPAAVSVLDSIACTTATNCVAVGYTFSSGNDAPLAEHWNGTGWASMTLPTPAGASSPEFTGVSCTSASACTAIGAYSAGVYPNTTSEVLAERWNGRTWSIQSVADQNISLFSVKCISASACIAAGVDANQDALAEYWNGSSWKAQPTAVIGGEFNRISCTSATSCYAVGQLNNATPLAAYWNGASWQAQPTPSSISGSSFAPDWLQSLSCTSATACMAVGQSFLSGPEDVNSIATLAERRT